MIRLKPVETKKKRVCPACYAKGEVIDDCHQCHGAGIIKSKTIRYNVVARPVEIIKVDRDPKTGIIRYWENQSEFFYETTTPKLNKYVPEVPFGIHLTHESYEDAFAEATRVNKALDELEVKATKGFVAKPWYVQNAENINTEANIGSPWELCKLLTDNQHIDKYLEDIKKLKIVEVNKNVT
jgi:hypothetical protein